MNFKSALIVLFLAFLNFSAFAGTLDSIGVSKINDKIHVRYMVSPGETIYGISTKYGVPVSDLMELNPVLENGLKVGQVINIPYNAEAVKAAAKKYDDNTMVHKVQPGETYYGLAKKYNTSVNDLMKFNNIELKAGQEIIVGYKNQVKTTSVDTAKTISQNTVKPVEDKKPVTENKPVAKTPNTTTNTNTATNNNTTNANTNLDPKVNTKNNVTPDNTKLAPDAQKAMEMYPFDASRQQVMVIPFDPYLYFSDADDEIAAKSNMHRTKVRQVFRKRLNALIDPPAYETIHLLGGKAKDSLSDLNKIYGMVTYNYQQSLVSPYYQEEQQKQEVEVKKNKNWLEKQKQKLSGSTTPSDSKYDIPTDHGSYFGVVIKNPEFFNYFNTKYSVDYYIFISQFEVKTNYENCLDRAALNYERTFTTHFSIFDASGKQIAGNKFKTHYNSNSNYIYSIVSDNMDKVAKRILQELPPPGKNQ